MAWPRGCALAEVGWSGERRPRFSQWRKRLEKRLEAGRAGETNTLCLEGGRFGKQEYGVLIRLLMI